MWCHDMAITEVSYFDVWGSRYVHKNADLNVQLDSWILANGKSVKSLCVAYLSKKIRLALKLLLLRESCPKSARASPKHCTHRAPDFIQIGSLSAEL